MGRTGPSAAEVELLAELERRGATASASQLERWRSAGILPANVRTYLGRGRGSRSKTAEITLDIVEAMALAARPGRSVYEAALRIVTVDPRHNDLFVYPGLRLPPGAIKAALSWYRERGDTSLNRRVERALQRYRDEPDEASRAAARLISDHYRALRRSPPAVVRYQPSSLKETDPRSAQADATMALARFFGYREVAGCTQTWERRWRGGVGPVRCEDAEPVLESLDRVGPHGRAQGQPVLVAVVAQLEPERVEQPPLQAARAKRPGNDLVVASMV